MSQPKKKEEEEADAAKSSFRGHQVTADGCCGGSGSLNNAGGGGLKLKRHWAESPDKQAKSGRIKSVTLFTKPPTAPLLLVLSCSGSLLGRFSSSLFLRLLSKTKR